MPNDQSSPHTARRPLRVAIVGAGPAGIYAADALSTSKTAAESGVEIDLFERMPAPYGLIRYGVAPDHPRIKGIVAALDKVLDKPEVRFFGNVDFGTDIDLATLRVHYDAVVFSTGASQDRSLDIPGIDLEGSHGAAQFVDWYDGNPDGRRTWPLDARKVAVLGVGNVALDIARMLAKTADELYWTDIPSNVVDGIVVNEAVEVHVFGRRGPAQAKFAPLELRELDHSPNIEVVVSSNDIAYDEGSQAQRDGSKVVQMVTKTLEGWAEREPQNGLHKVFLHFFESPHEVLGDDGRVVGLRTERTELDGAGNVRSTGRFTDWDVQAVYRAVGYVSSVLPDLPFDPETGVIPNEGGRVIDESGRPIEGVYVTGWIRRGPVGLIGHTKGDAKEMAANLITDAAAQETTERSGSITDYLESKGVPYTTLEGWQRLDAYERELGARQGRQRIKVVERSEMLSASGIELIAAVSEGA